MASLKISKTVQIIILIILIIAAILIGLFLFGKEKEPQPAYRPSEKQTQTSSPASSEVPSSTKAPEEIPVLSKERTEKLIKAFTSSIVFGLYIDLENSGPENLPIPPSSEYENFYRAGFNSIDEGIEFTKQYLAEDVFKNSLEISKDAYFTVDGVLYAGVGSRGYPSYEPDTIVIKQNEKIASVYIDVFDFGEYIETDVFTAEYIDGNWKMTSAPKFDSKKNNQQVY